MRDMLGVFEMIGRRLSHDPLSFGKDLKMAS